MQATIGSRCLRAREFLLRRGEMMIMDCSRISCHSTAVHFRPPRSQTLTTARSLCIGVSGSRWYHRRNPWDVSRSTPYFFKHLNCFLSDSPPRPPQPPGSMPNGYALFSTATGSDVVRKKQGAKQEQTTAVVKGGDPEKQVADTKILRTLVKYLWLKDNPEFRLRVLISLGFLVGAKLLNVQVPFLFKLAVDWLTIATGNASALTSFTTANSTALALFVSPAAVLVGYGIARAGASAFNELRTAVFSKVALRTIRSVSRKVFAHLHELDLQFHLRLLWRSRIEDWHIWNMTTVERN